jgi:hypothetical protein
MHFPQLLPHALAHALLLANLQLSLLQFTFIAEWYADFEAGNPELRDVGGGQ